jgi:hypothetical protein
MVKFVFPPRLINNQGFGAKILLESFWGVITIVKNEYWEGLGLTCVKCIGKFKNI